LRAVICLLGVLFLAAASFAVAQEKHGIDPMLPGSLNPKPLPPLKNPGAPSIPAKELFARKLSMPLRLRLQTERRPYVPASTAVTAFRRAPDERMMNFSISTMRKNTTPPPSSNGQIDNGMAALSNSRWSGGA